jgi:membrane-associated protease RseP (regulator of RpoE activity)
MNRLGRYSPLVELLALFSVVIASRFAQPRPADRPSARHVHRATPTVVQPPARLDPERIARLTDLPEHEPTPCGGNLNDIAMQARIVPAFRDGVAVGFKLFSIRPDSIYAELGIQNGDIVTSINDLDLNSPEKALEIYSKLKGARRFDIGIERGTQWIHVIGTLPDCPTNAHPVPDQPPGVASELH